MIGGASAVRLVAEREVRARLRSKAFAITLAVTALAFLALPIATHLAGGGSTKAKVAVTDQGFARTLRAVATQLHQPVSVRVVADPAAGRKAVSDGDVDAYAAPGASGIDATVHSSLEDSLRAVFSAAQQRAALDQQITRLGGDPRAVADALSGVRLSVHTQEPTDPAQGQKTTVAIAAGLLMYMVLMIVGQMVAQGVVEEKTSRVVELLLATLRPWQLMAGKILGLGVIGLVQLLVPGAVGLVVAIALGELEISLAASVGTLCWSLAWFAAGFALYAMLFAAVGALVSRQEDLNGLMVPLMMPLVVGWVLGVSVLPTDPGNNAAAVLSFVPFLSPVLMPMRWALGVAPWWQPLVALVLTLLLSVVALRFAGRIYRNSVLRSGARVPLREALRAA